MLASERLEKDVICLLCKQGEAEPGRATVTVQREGCTVIFKGVPADICENCGEYYVSESVSGELLRRAEVAARNGAEVEILAYAA
jgi:YgiT-type zinc finger domain-containing protein